MRRPAVAAASVLYIGGTATAWRAKCITGMLCWPSSNGAHQRMVARRNGMKRLRESSNKSYRPRHLAALTPPGMYHRRNIINSLRGAHGGGRALWPHRGVAYMHRNKADHTLNQLCILLWQRSIINVMSRGKRGGINDLLWRRSCRAAFEK